MDELEIFFEAMKGGKESPVAAVREALGRKCGAIAALQKETMLSEGACARRLDDLARLAKMCEKIGLLQEKDTEIETVTEPEK